MFSHICYGTAMLLHGGLKFTARAAGRRGEQVTLRINQENVEPAVAVTSPGLGAGDIVITTPVGTTEQQIIGLVNASADFHALASVEQASGDGTGLVNALAKTAFVAAGGLRQHLQSRLGIQIWEDRNQLATGAATGFIYLFDAKTRIISPPDSEYSDYFNGQFTVVIAFQGKGFEEENCVLDLYRYLLHHALKTFCHDDLEDKGPIEYTYSNGLKDEAVNSENDEAYLKIEARMPVKWTEPSTEERFVLQRIQPGLYREPLVDPLGAGGGEVLDTVLTIQPE